ncbi:MAG: hypothetical protein IMZ69_03165 [Spirochaetes bacterium]|nr:hypothetical protein [Spirochaetota bacterium]
MELLKPDGRIISGLPCIYHLPNGLMFFTEAVREDGDSYIFDPEKTLQIIMQPSPTPGQMTVIHFKGFRAMPFQPTSVRAGKGGVVVTDCTDPKLLASWRSALSGIVIAGPGVKMPDGEKVN